MKASGIYEIDNGVILHKCYRLLCVFFASKEMARRSDPNDEFAPLTSLERLFFVPEASRLLLELAVAVRVVDDQMRKLPHENEQRVKYERRKAAADRFTFGLFDDLGLNLRQTCNKIIHSDVMEPHTTEGYEPHELDIAHKHGDGDRTIDWEHLNGYIRLCGADRGEEWYVLLDLEAFVIAIYELFSDGGAAGEAASTRHRASRVRDLKPFCTSAAAGSYKLIGMAVRRRQSRHAYEHRVSPGRITSFQVHEHRLLPHYFDDGSPAAGSEARSDDR